MQLINSKSEQNVIRADSLERMLGWHSAAVFEVGADREDDRPPVTTTTEIIVLTDPYPEYKQFVFEDGELWHTAELTSETYEKIFEQTLRDYGEATIVPLSEIDCIQRNDRNIPKHTK